MPTSLARPIPTPYEDLLRKIMDEGVDRGDRTGTGTRSLFGQQLRYDLEQGFPLLTTKKVHTKSVIYELLWFLRGDNNVRWLQERGVTIWDSWQQKHTLDRELVLVPKRTAVPDKGYDGTFRVTANGGDHRLESTWVAMMRRCYDPTHHRYASYGATGATVHPDWHDFLTFSREVKDIPHWRFKEESWESFELDKDYYGAFQYGKETSVWLHTAENNYYMKSANPIRVVDPDGTSHVFVSQAAAARHTGISTTTLSRFLNEGLPTVYKGHNKDFKEWTFSRDTPVRDDEVLRMALIPDGTIGEGSYGPMWRSWPRADGSYVDQISDALDLIKNNPESRRILVSAWNPAEVHKAALPPCHVMFQFYVANGKLNCHLYQRSCDVFLGVPFNIASYALLTHMMAAQAGLGVGEFVWTGGDTHIYHNHFDQVAEQLSREPRPYPTLELAHRDSLFDYQLEDFTFHGYDPHPAIKAPVAV